MFGEKADHILTNQYVNFAELVICVTDRNIELIFLLCCVLQLMLYNNKFNHFSVNLVINIFTVIRCFFCFMKYWLNMSTKKRENMIMLLCFSYFCIWREQLPPRHIRIWRSVMLILWIGNIGNFTITHKDGIVVLTHIAWAAITAFVCKGYSYDLQFRM